MEKSGVATSVLALAILTAILGAGLLGVFIKYRELGGDYDELKNKYQELKENHSTTLSNLRKLEQEYADLQAEHETLKGTAALPPYTLIENRNVRLVFNSSDGSLHRWTVPVETLEYSVMQGHYRRELIPERFVPMLENLYYWYYDFCVRMEALLSSLGQPADFSSSLDNSRDMIENVASRGVTYVKLSDDGETHYVADFRPFVEENIFSTVMSDLYYELDTDDEAVVHEIWYIATQLTTYHEEIEDTPRYPMETLIGGGGDCEDMAILISSMLKAVPADYTVKLVYMDGSSPQSPQNVNHVTVWVDTPSGYDTFVEGTENADMCPYDQVEGWRFEV